MRNLPLWTLAALLPAVGALGAAADGPYPFPGARPPGATWIVVPDVAGRGLGEAEAQLRDAGFQAALAPAQADLALHPRLALFRVGAQDPRAGSALARGASVTLTLATDREHERFGPPGFGGGLPHERDRGEGGRGERFGRRLFMPEVTGFPVHQARRLLEDQGVPVSVEERLAPEAALDVVLAQQPSADTPLRWGAQAVLSVARSARVPSLLGLAPGEARERAAQAGLELRVKGGLRAHGFPRLGRGDFGPRPGFGGPFGQGFPYPELRVESQSRAYASRVALGSVIAVRLSPAPMALPSAPGSGFPYLPYGAPPLPGAGALPAPGFAPPTGPRPDGLVAVPDVVGQSLPDARALLEGLGLGAEVAGDREEPRPGGRPGSGPGLAPPTVASQDVAAGSRVVRGTSVRLTLALRRR